MFDAHDRALVDFGDHCGRGIHHNMTTAVMWTNLTNALATLAGSPELDGPDAGGGAGRHREPCGGGRPQGAQPTPARAVASPEIDEACQQTEPKEQGQGLKTAMFRKGRNRQRRIRCGSLRKRHCAALPRRAREMNGLRC